MNWIQDITGLFKNISNPKGVETDLLSKINNNPDLLKVYQGKMTLRNWYSLGEYGPALVLLKSEFGKLGYNVGKPAAPDISAEIIYDFQRICGLYEGGGTIIGAGTLRSLVAASEAAKSGKSWRKAVAGMHDGKVTKDMKKIRNIHEKLSDIKIGYQGFDLGWDPPKILIDAYLSLGFNVKGENLLYANYKFQIISGVNEQKSLYRNYGPSTHKALIKAFKALEEGKDWRAAF